MKHVLSSHAVPPGVRAMPTIILLTACLSVLLAFPEGASAGGRAASGPAARSKLGQELSAGNPNVGIVESDHEKIILEFWSPDFALGREQVGDVEYEILQVEGGDYALQRGEPQLPVVGALVGIPPDATLRWRILGDETRLLSVGRKLKPVPSLVISYDSDRLPTYQGKKLLENPEVYQVDRFYPTAPVQLTEEGRIRDQSVAAFAFYPFQYNPVRGEILHHEYLLVEVAFDYDTTMHLPEAPTRRDDPYFEPLMQSVLLNYEDAKPWRIFLGSNQVGTYDRVSSEHPPYKILVNEDGIHHITYAELLEAGFDVSIDPATLQLYNQGEEVAIWVEGAEDGQFDPQDYIEFLGETRDSIYGDTEVYWLYSGAGQGLRMPQLGAAPAGADMPSFFTDSLHLEEDHVYMSHLPLRGEGDHWYWTRLRAFSGPASEDYVFAIHDVEPLSFMPKFRILMAGNTDLDPNPDHHVKFYVNGTQIGDCTWNGRALHLFESAFPQDLLASGSNTVTVELPRDLPGVPYDYVMVNWLEIDYGRRFVAQDGKLVFSDTVSGKRRYKVEGFAAEDVSVYDITDPGSVVCLADYKRYGPGPYSVEFEVELSSAGSFLLRSPNAYVSVDSADIVASHQTDLRDSINSADYVAIGPSEFEQILEPLLALREHQGYRVRYVALKDIYDEFGFGMESAEAVRDLLAWAYENWVPPAPSYVLLVGDGHFDFRDLMGTGEPNLVPPFLAPVDPWINETAADNRYGMISGADTLPDLFIGRLPANNDAELQAMVDKVVAYEEAVTDDSWNRKIVFAADDYDPDAGDFAEMSDALISDYITQPYASSKAYLGVTCPYQNPSLECKSELLEAINGGCLLVNYIGHGSIQYWAKEKLLHVDYISELNNLDRLPVMLPMDCYDGFYHYPGYPSLGESVVRVGGRGAVASWSASGLGVATGHDYLDRGFFEGLFGYDLRELGPLTHAGLMGLWATRTNRDLIDTFHLFGDPALRINALDPDLHLTKAVEPSGQVEPGDVLTYTLTFTNSGQATAHHVELVDLLDPLLISPTVVYSTPAMFSPRPGVTYTWDVADLDVGDQGQIQFRAVVSPTTGPDIVVNRAELNSPASSDVVTVTTGIQVPDLYVAKTGPLTATYGQMITYSIAWGNTGATGAPDPRLTDVLPPWVSYLGDSSGWSLTEPTPGTLLWDMAPNPLPTGTHGAFVVSGWVTLGLDMVGPLVNRARVESDLPDADPANSQAEWSTHLRLPDLSVEVSGPMTVTPRSEASFDISYANVGDQVAENVVISAELAPGLVWLGDDSGLEHSEPTPGVHVWRLPGGDLAPAEGHSFAVEVSVGGAHETGLALATTVRIGGDTPDPVAENDEGVWRAAMPWHVWYYFPLAYPARP